MAWVLARHKIQDYARWRPIFDGTNTILRGSGAREGFVFRNADDPSEIIVLLEWDSIARARQFMTSERLHHEMDRAGVADQPTIFFLDELDKPAL